MTRKKRKKREHLHACQHQIIIGIPREERGENERRYNHGTGQKAISWHKQKEHCEHLCLSSGDENSSLGESFGEMQVKSVVSLFYFLIFHEI
jgi:hypothetical protein